MNIAIVTGASSGMGKEFVLQMHKYVTVDQVWVIARRESALQALQEVCPVPVRPIPLDLCNQESFAICKAVPSLVKKGSATRSSRRIPISPSATTDPAPVTIFVLQ